MEKNGKYGVLLLGDIAHIKKIMHNFLRMIPDVNLLPLLMSKMRLRNGLHWHVPSQKN